MARTETENIDYSIAISHLYRLNGVESMVFFTWFVNKSTFHISQNLIAKRCGITQRQVARAMKSLVEKNILVLEEKNSFNVNVYDFSKTFHSLVDEYRKQGRPSKFLERIQELRKKLQKQKGSKISVNEVWQAYKEDAKKVI